MNNLFLSLFVGLIGSGYFLYGKKASEIWFMLAGGALIFFPYFVEGAMAMFLIAAVLCAWPFVMQRFDWP